MACCDRSGACMWHVVPACGACVAVNGCFHASASWHGFCNSPRTDNDRGDQSMRRKQKGPDAALIAMLLSGALGGCRAEPGFGSAAGLRRVGPGRQESRRVVRRCQAGDGRCGARPDHHLGRARPAFRGRAFRHLRDSGGPAGAEAGIELCARPGQGWAGLGRAESVDHGCERPGARGDVARGRSGRDPAGVYFHQRVPVSRPLAGRDELRRPENCRWRQLRCGSGDTEGCRAAGNLVRSLRRIW